MKISYIINSLHNSAGMERIVTTKANYLADVCGYDVTIFTTDQQNRPLYFNLSDKVKHDDLGIDFSEMAGWNIFRKTWGFIHKQRRFRALLTKILLKQNNDIVISTFGPEVEWLYKIKDGSRKISEIHFSKYFRLQGARNGLWRLSDLYRTWRDERVIAKYDKFVVLTTQDKQYWGTKGNIIAIPNACHISNTTPSKVENTQAIAIGRLTFQKGYNNMIDAWRKVADKHPNWILNIYGSGEDKDILQNQISQQNLNGKIILNAPQSQIENQITQHSIFLLSSRCEGFGLVIIEAMACGVPCVAFDCKCGPRDIITDGVDGYLVTEGDVNEMAAKTCELIENKELRQQMGANAIRKVKEKFSIDVVMKQWVELFNSLRN